jgi:hypothetical protein
LGIAVDELREFICLIGIGARELPLNLAALPGQNLAKGSVGIPIRALSIERLGDIGVNRNLRVTYTGVTRLTVGEIGYSGVSEAGQCVAGLQVSDGHEQNHPRWQDSNHPLRLLSKDEKVLSN